MMSVMLLIDQSSNTVVNTIVADSNYNPSEGFVVLDLETTKTKIWNYVDQELIQIQSIGNGGIGFTWDGEFLVSPIPEQPVIINESEPNVLVE